MKKIIIAFLMVAFSCACARAVPVFKYRPCLDGTGCLSSVSTSNIEDENPGMAGEGNAGYLFYTYDSSSAAAESLPWVMRPDSLPATGRWFLRYVIPSVQFVSGLEVALDWAGDSTHDVIVSPGAAMDSTGKYVIPLTTAMTKRIDAAWATGTGNGGAQGTFSGDDMAHVCLLYNPSSYATDVSLDTSATCANSTGGSFTNYRWLGYLMTSSGTTIYAQNLVFGQGNTITQWLQDDGVDIATGLTTSASFATQSLATFVGDIGERVTGVLFGAVSAGAGITAVGLSVDGTNGAAHFGASNADKTAGLENRLYAFIRTGVEFIPIDWANEQIYFRCLNYNCDLHIRAVKYFR